MQKVKEGDYVTITYEGVLADGEIFETATEDAPFEFMVGQNSVYPSFESGVIGMQPGETRSITVSSEEAYGPRIEELVQTFERKVFGDRIEPKPGMVVGMTVERDGENHQVPATIVEVAGETVTVDYNHPLAGQDLFYRITLQSVVEAKAQADASSCGCEGADCNCN